MNLRNNDGIVVIAAVFLLAITSLFVSIIQKNKRQNFEIVRAYSSMAEIDNILKFATIFISKQIQEDIDFANKYQAYSDSQTSIVDSLSINNASVSINLSGDLTQGPIIVTITVSKNSITRSLSITFAKNSQVKRMAIIADTRMNPDITDRVAFFQQAGWDINLITRTSDLLDVLSTNYYDVIYLTNSINIARNTLTSLHTTVVTESINNSDNMDLLLSSTIFTTINSNMLTSQNSSTFYAANTEVNVSTSPSFDSIVASSLVQDAIIQFSSTDAVEPLLNPVIIWLPKGSNTSNGITIQDRLYLNFTSSWDNLEESGKNLIANLVDQSVCANYNCTYPVIKNITLE